MSLHRGLEAHAIIAALGVPCLNCEDHISLVGHADRLARVGLKNTTLSILAWQVIMQTLALHIADGLSEAAGGT